MSDNPYAAPRSDLGTGSLEEGEGGSGDFDIGLSFDDARRNIRKEPGQNDVGEKVIVFNITDEIPNDVVAYRNDLPASLAEAVYAATEAFLATEEGEAIFDEIYGWTAIRPAIESDFDVVREAKDKLGITGSSTTRPSACSRNAVSRPLVATVFSRTFAGRMSAKRCFAPAR